MVTILLLSSLSLLFYIYPYKSYIVYSNLRHEVTVYFLKNKFENNYNAFKNIELKYKNRFKDNNDSTFSEKIINNKNIWEKIIINSEYNENNLILYLKKNINEFSGYIYYENSSIIKCLKQFEEDLRNSEKYLTFKIEYLDSNWIAYSHNSGYPVGIDYIYYTNVFGADDCIGIGKWKEKIHNNKSENK